jgi:hypothetical protein
VIPKDSKSAKANSFDFCHQCKQLKNSYLLVACKCKAQSIPIYPNNPLVLPVFPYEPHYFLVNNSKIYNADLQNPAVIRQLIFKILKDLKTRNANTQCESEDP